MAARRCFSHGNGSAHRTIGGADAAPFWLAAVASALICLSAAASAQRSICGSHKAVAEHLANHWGEAVRWRGLTGGMLIELYTAKDGGWTLVMTRPDGVACFAAAGRDGEAIERAVDGEEKS